MDLTENLGIPKVRGIKFKDLNKADLVGFNYAPIQHTYIRRVGRRR